MRAQSILGRVLCGAVLTVTGLACDLESTPEGRPISADFETEADEIVENLRLAGFPDEEIQVFGDTVVLGFDAEVSLRASREMAGVRRVRGANGEDEDRQYYTNNLVSQSVDTICINGSAFNNNSSLNTGLNNAIDNYNNLNLGFTMVRTNGGNNGCDAVINTNISGSGGGSAGFPSGGQPYGLINVGGSMNTSNATHVIQHELGHCIGFRHTDYFDRSISCGSGGNEGSAGIGANHIPGTPTGAVFNGSVMNACYNGGSNGDWSASDVTALEFLYPGNGGGDGGGGDGGGGDGGDGGGGDGGGDGGSCEGRCGNYDAALSCQCDAQCESYGDCCADKGPVCDGPPPPQPGPDSCVDKCGGKSTTCWCDNLCANYGDCCENKQDVCG